MAWIRSYTPVMRTCLAWIRAVHTCNMCDEDVSGVDTVSTYL